ncbi:hypothetical protein HAPAU_02470 [Halalkalicoccus paucihalophilus]|uniref:Uncharacterized protein n=1 Tax=Halalkalicoccus paucihalophilus TaxID=1008153 RepID=A0A151AIT7_9EURY|nr:hypothetical protein [Halalkalicoccus paucihalophilus]KYH27579.1 hypothetical protein HAPAU_02470 [Halalkalicoccus paucihalophilus]
MSKDRPDHVVTHQHLWAGVLLGITPVVAAFEVADGGSVLYGAFLGLLVALPITTVLLSPRRRIRCWSPEDDGTYRRAPRSLR